MRIYALPDFKLYHSGKLTVTEHARQWDASGLPMSASTSRATILVSGVQSFQVTSPQAKFT
jgi:hypothetical protein